MSQISIWKCELRPLHSPIATMADIADHNRNHLWSTSPETCLGNFHVHLFLIIRTWNLWKLKACTVQSITLRWSTLRCWRCIREMNESCMRSFYCLNEKCFQTWNMWKAPRWSHLCHSTFNHPCEHEQEVENSTGEQRITPLYLLQHAKLCWVGNSTHSYDIS